MGEDNESHSVSEKKFICQQEIMKTLIKNGRIVTAIDDYKADILIEDETISLLGKGGLYGNIIRTGMMFDSTKDMLMN